MPAEGVEPVVPQGAVRLEPRIELGQRRRVEVVEPALRVTANLDQPVIAEHAQVLRNARLTQPRPLDNLPNRARPLTKKVEDLAPAGLRHSSNRICHIGYITRLATL